jgi:hypothetical protein
MTSEELATSGLSPNRDDAHESEDIHVRESDLDNTSARDSETREEGEVRSEGEDLENVEADLRDLMRLLVTSLLVMVVPLSTSKSPLLHQTKL